MPLNNENPPVVDVIILTAISLEFDAVLQVEDGSLPGSEWRNTFTEDKLPIAFRAFLGQQSRPLQLAVAQAGGMGAVDAAITLSPLVQEYRPSCIAMCGVCAGRRQVTQLGDVIAADRLFYHDSGKKLPQEVLQDLETYSIERSWRVAIDRFRFRERFQGATWWSARPIPREWQENWVLAQLNEGHENPSSLPECRNACPEWEPVIADLLSSGHVRIQGARLLLAPKGRKRIERVLIQFKGMPDLSPSGRTLPFKVHVAPIGSGNMVVEDESIWGYVSKYMRKTLGIEMEAAVVGQVAHARNCRALVMKGVMDFANEGRDDHFKGFAARAAAECLIAFLREEIEPKSYESGTMPRKGKVKTAHDDQAITLFGVREAPSRVLSVGRPPARYERQVNQTQPPRAHRVAVASLLGSLVQDEVIFNDACAEAGLPRDLFWAATSASDRWFSAITTAAQAGVFRRLMESASRMLPLELRWRLELTDSEAMLQSPHWDREELYRYRISSRQMRSREVASNPDVLGVSALRRIWGSAEPELGALRNYLDNTEEEAPSIVEEVHDGNNRHKIQLGLAAEHLLVWCETAGGEQALAWMVEHLDRLSSARFALVTAMMEWWNEGRERLANAAREIRDQSLELLSRESMDAALARLNSLDRLLCEVEAEWWGGTETLPSVQLAIRTGRLSSIAALLEAVGERRPDVFIGQMSRLYQDRDAVVALARALRRLRIAGLEGDPEDPELRFALNCSLPEATAKEIGSLVAEPRKRALWLDLLSPPLSDNQLGGLIEIHSNARHAWERDRARRWLCTALDPVAVWRRLTDLQRSTWIEEFTDFELILVASLAGQRPPAGSSERHLWTRLQRRLATVRKVVQQS